MSRDEKGAYVDLLVAQFNTGHMSLKSIQSILGSDFDSMWPECLSKKFIPDSNGLYFNDFLDEIIQRRENFKINRLKNLGISSPCGTPTRTPHMGSPCAVLFNRVEGKDKKGKRGGVGGEREGEGKEGEKPTWDSHMGNDEAAESLFNMFPKDSRKLAGIKEIKKALSEISFDELSKYVSTFAKSVRGTEKRFIPTAASWFLEKRWREISEVKKADYSGVKRTNEYLEKIKLPDSEIATPEQVADITSNILKTLQVKSTTTINPKPILLTHLPPDKVQRIFELMPMISVDYINEKISIMQNKNPEDKESFLYSSIIQNYKLPVKEQKKTNTPGHLDQTAYDALPEGDKLNYSKQEHHKPSFSTYKLSQMPYRILAPERFAFKHMKVGDEVDEASFRKLSPKTQEFFKRINHQPETIFMYHSKNS
jgi:hypothetical protein